MPRPLLILAPLLIAAPAVAQVPANAPQAVDQAVGDLDPLSVSLRRVDPGNARFSGRNAVLRLPETWGSALPQLPGAASPAYVFQGPGVRAFVRRPEYLVYDPWAPEGVSHQVAPAVDGMHHAVVPADTVFDLTPRAGFELPAPALDDGRPDVRLDGRIDPAFRHTGTHRAANIDLGPEHAVNGLSPARLWQRHREAHAEGESDPRDPRELPFEAVYGRGDSDTDPAEPTPPR